MQKFLFARIHFETLFDNQCKLSVLDDFKKIEEIDGFIETDWFSRTMQDIWEEEIDGIKYIFGKVIKILPKKDQIVVNEDTKKEEIFEINNSKDNESFFLINLKYHLMSFQIHKNFTKKQFQNFLVAAYEKIQSFCMPKLDFTYDEGQLLEQLKNFKIARTAKFSLQATNPSSTEEFEALDNWYHESWIKESSLYFRAEKWNSLNIWDKKSLVRNALAMSAYGYGNGTIYWEDLNGKPYQLNTWDNRIDKIEINETATSEEIKRQIIIKFEEKQKYRQTIDLTDNNN